MIRGEDKMTITVKLSDVLDAVAGMRWLADQPLPAKFAYSVMKLQRKLEAEITDFLNLRKSKMHAYGMSEGGAESGDESRSKEFQKEIADLIESEVSIDMAKLPWAVLEGLDGITPAYLHSVSPFFSLPEDLE